MTPIAHQSTRKFVYREVHRGVASLIGALSFAASVATTASGQGPTVELAPTFTRHVAPIVYAKCVVCHRDGEIGPMSLITFKDVQPWIASIRKQLVIGAMPPFHSESKYGMFPNAPRLTAVEMSTILRWIDAGAPEGDPTALPPLPVLPPRR